MARLKWFLLLLVVACASGSVPRLPGPSEAPELYTPHVEAEYRLQVGDQISLRSYYDPQLDQQVRVRSDGRVSLLLLGDVYVVGMTIAELERMVTESYRSVVDSPEVSVVLDDSAGQRIFLSGEVRSPSMQQLNGPLTVLQAISLAGGFLSTANKEQVLLLRSAEAGTLDVHSIDVTRILANAMPDVYLRSHDVLYVPKTGISNVDQFVDQYINQIIPEAVRGTIGWQWISGSQLSVGN